MIARRSVAKCEVFAVPGNITNRNSFGTNYPIKSAGAKLVQTWQGVAAELPPEVAARLLPPEPGNRKKEEGRAESGLRTLGDLADEERAVIKHLSVDDPTHVDALAEMSGLPVQALAGVPLSLAKREPVRQLPGKCFARKI